MPPVSLRVLISGGGIAGNALAFWLAKQGHDVTVVERFPNLRLTGLQLDLRGHGVEVLRRMGLEDSFRAKAAPEQGMQVVDSSGKRRAYFPANKSGTGRQAFTSDFEIMRGDLCGLLYDAAKTTNKSPQYLFGTWVESFAQDTDSKSNPELPVEVRFDNGKTDRFDLLVGADGQWSRTRRMMVGPGNPDGLQRIPGLNFAYFTMARPMQPGEEYLATSYMAPGRRGIMTRRHSPDAMQVMLSCRSDPDRLQNVTRGDVKAEKEAMADIFKGAGWIADDIIKAMRDADDFYCERMGLVNLRPWSKGYVTLVGDAAHCPTVLTGMGTTSAMVGAYILAGEISTQCADDGDGRTKAERVERALEGYERKFRPYMDHVQKDVLRNAHNQWAMAGSAFSVGVMNWLLGVAAFFKINMAEAFGIRDDIKGWDLPEYERMVKG
jgi:2-polyprenyl-6-methoxyphenol hydroxylase-like FAD-dependent oxidoreductase